MLGVLRVCVTRTLTVSALWASAWTSCTLLLREWVVAWAWGTWACSTGCRATLASGWASALSTLSTRCARVAVAAWTWRTWAWTALAWHALRGSEWVITWARAGGTSTGSGAVLGLCLGWLGCWLCRCL